MMREVIIVCGMVDAIASNKLKSEVPSYLEQLKPSGKCPF